MINLKLKTLFTDLLFVSVLSLFTVSCSNNNKTDDSKDVAEEHNEAKFNDNKTENDAQFLVNAAGLALKEIQLSNMALNSGTMGDVKEVARMMEAEHTKSLNDLNRLAEGKQITLPTNTPDNGLDAYKNLSNKTGQTFDKDYCDIMVSDHKEAINLFENAIKDCKDEDIREWARTTLPTLRTHLDHAIACQDKVQNVASYK